MPVLVLVMIVVIWSTAMSSLFNRNLYKSFNLDCYMECCRIIILNFISFSRNTPIGRNNSVPDSCCHQVTAGCGNGILVQQESDIRNKIFVDGCITILKVINDNEIRSAQRP